MGSTQNTQYHLGSDLTSGNTECFLLINDAIARETTHEVMFFIHGYRTSAEGAVLEATNLALDMHFSGTLIVWAWPSDGYGASYLKDEETSAFIGPRVSTFLSTLIKQNKDSKFELIAHSMGSRILLLALMEIAKTVGPSAVESVVFAAPDVAQDIFQSQLNAAYGGGSSSVYRIATLYSSSEDKALAASYLAHRGPRAGSAGRRDVLVMPIIETIDASALASWFGTNHSYIFEEPRAIRDLGLLVLRKLPAGQRFLDEDTKNSIKYWLLR
jgi:esterase/lipase superfamily enzyme